MDASKPDNGHINILLVSSNVEENIKQVKRDNAHQQANNSPESTQTQCKTQPLLEENIPSISC